MPERNPIVKHARPVLYFVEGHTHTINIHGKGFTAGDEISLYALRGKLDMTVRTLAEETDGAILTLGADGNDDIWTLTFTVPELKTVPGPEVVPPDTGELEITVTNTETGTSDATVYP